MQVVVSPSATQQNTLLRLSVPCVMLGANWPAAGNLSSNVLDSSPTWRGVTAFVFGRVVRTFALCFFNLPLKVASGGVRYIFTILGELRHGIVLS